MPTVQRSRTITAPPEDVDGLVADPHHMPRWWPGVQGMEGVEDDVFTQVFMTKKGRRVRAVLGGPAIVPDIGRQQDVDEEFGIDLRAHLAACDPAGQRLGQHAVETRIAADRRHAATGPGRPTT